MSSRLPGDREWTLAPAAQWAPKETKGYVILTDFRRTKTAADVSLNFCARANTTDDCCRLPADPILTSPNRSPENYAMKRLQLELKDFMMSDDTGISAFPAKDTIMSWKGSITGGKGSVFEGKQYTLSLHFPSNYPFKPPVVRFDSPAPFHPNVGDSCYRCYGKFKLDILHQDWSSAYDVRTVLLSIKTMIEDPNLSAPVNLDAARLWSNQKEYRKMVEKLYDSPQY